jgi:hypothetical protein
MFVTVLTETRMDPKRVYRGLSVLRFENMSHTHRQRITAKIHCGFR